MKKKNSSFEDLEVYQKLCKLHLEIHRLTIEFPKIELHEIGYQLRKSSNSAPASIAEGYSRKNGKFNVEKIEKALGDIRQTKHYLNMALKKQYIENVKYTDIICQYDECENMLRSLEKTIKSYKYKHNTFTKNQMRNNYYS